MTRGRTELSRTLSHALRHQPWLYELELDGEGWVSLDALVEALRQDARWRDVTAEEVGEVVAGGSKQRHEIVEGRIRARYGHSIPQRLRLTAALPPAVLFHGTSPAAAEQIAVAGLLPSGRQYVHLSSTRDMADAVGRRKSPTPVVLSVDTVAASSLGVVFYAGSDQVWLADAVPAVALAQ
jgi:putative RNA 2'-phosphotransferase